MRFLICLIGSLAAFSPALVAQTLTYTDKLGHTTHVETPVRRAVVYQLYEFLPALGAWDQVVGVGQAAFQKELILRAKPDIHTRVTSVGGGVDINIEALLRLKPDVVLNWTYRPDNARFMEGKGLKVISVYPDSFGEMNEVITLMGRLFGRANEAQVLLDRMNGIFTLVKNRATQVAPDKRAKVLWIYSKENSVGAGNSLANEMIATVGATNAAGALAMRNTEASMETIVGWNPDVIFIWGNAKYSAREILDNPRWRFVNAVRNKRVFKAPEWSTWSPCLAPTVLWMASKTYPDVYRDIDYQSLAVKYFREVFGTPVPVSGRNDF